MVQLPSRHQLMRGAPFAQMAPALVDHFIAAAEPAAYKAGQRVLSPADGPVQHLYCIVRGSITGQHGMAEAAGGFHYEVGDLFPVGAVMGRRPVTATYTAIENDTQCLRVPVAEVQQLAAQSPPFADFLNRRITQFLQLSRRALQVAYASQTLAESSLEAPLGALPRKEPATVAPGTPLREALALMHGRHVGSVLVVDAAGALQGILTRHDVLGRVALPELPIGTPVEAVMTTPAYSLTVADSVQDAALLMSRHGLRHVPVTERGRVVSVVSERDLFALQRLSLKQVGTAIREARNVDTLRLVADDIRRFARNLVGQGVAARQLTELVSHLNDVLTQQLLKLLAAEHGMDLGRACWLAFGSEGRSEQTIATDQDNGLVFDSSDPQRDRPAWLAFARHVNEALDACGYPLCKGNVMASNPECCLTPAEWHERFHEWMEHGAPEDLLKASIYFDLRPLAGRSTLAEGMREFITTQAARLPRFMKQMADNALRNRPPLNWLGAVETGRVDGREVVDLKMHGTAIFVDAARLYALAHGVAATNTRERLEAVAHLMHAGAQEAEAWIGAFEFLQLMRLRVQMEGRRDGLPAGNPNLIEPAALNDIDRRVLKEAFRIARRLQQRIALDYHG
ncbi:MAG: DUF294 nucleotidyltransferase-like domain-containing protein [Pseudomonadota bacterium]